MGRSQETFNKKEVRKKKEKKRKDKEAKRFARKESEKKGGLDNMIAYVDENGRLTDTPPDPGKKRKTKVEDIEISIPKQEDIFFDPIRKGKLTFFNDSKGFGFIKDSETSESIFVHVSDFKDDIVEGDVVNFEIMKGQRGPTAVQVKLHK